MLKTKNFLIDVFLDWIFDKSEISLLYEYSDEDFIKNIIFKISLYDIKTKKILNLELPGNKQENCIFLRCIRKQLFELKKYKIFINDLKRFLDYIPGDFIVNENCEIYDFLLLNSIIKQENNEIEIKNHEDLIKNIIFSIKKLDNEQINLYKKILLPCSYLFSSIEKSGIYTKFGIKKFIHYNLAGTISGRLTCDMINDRYINVQTLSKDERNLIVAPLDHCFIDADYNAMEMRVLAFISNDKIMNFIFDKDKDIYEFILKDILNENGNRQIAKELCIMISYGATKYGIAKKLNIDIENAEMIIGKFFNIFVDIEKWFLENQINVLEKRECKTRFGRIRKFSNDDDKEKIIRQSVNFEIQSSANDIILLSLLEINEKLLEGASIVLNVHDENLIMSPFHNIDGNYQMIKNIMNKPSKLLDFGIDNIKLKPIMQIKEIW